MTTKKALSKTYVINAPSHVVWAALTKPDSIAGWGGAPCVMDEKVGTKFSLWGGSIHGTNTEVVPEKTLMQDWSEKTWTEPSKVTFTLESLGTKTVVMLLHSEVPTEFYKSIGLGWDEFYLGPLKRYCEKK